MTTKNITTEICSIVGWVDPDVREKILNLIKQFKSKWEAESYIKGFNDACNQTKEYLNVLI